MAAKSRGTLVHYFAENNGSEVEGPRTTLKEEEEEEEEQCALAKNGGLKEEEEEDEMKPRPFI